MIASFFRLITGAACAMNYLLAIRLEIVVRLLERSDQKSAAKVYHAVIVALMVVYFAAVYAILYFRGFIYYTLLQVVAIFVLVSGYFIPTLLKVSQVNLAVGLNPLFFPRSRSISQDVSDHDISLDRGSSGNAQPKKHKIEEDYFSGYNRELARSSLIQSQAQDRRGKSKYLALIIPYLALLAAFGCFGIITTRIVMQVISMFNK